MAGRTSLTGRLGQGLYLAGMTGLADRHPPRGVRLLSANSDFGMGAGDEHVRDGHLGGPGGRGPVVRLRADLSQDVHGAGRVGRGASGHDHGGQRAAPGPQHPQPAAGAPQQLLADDPRADRGVQLRGLRPGLGAGPDRDALLPDGHLSPLAELRRIIAAAGPGPSPACRRNGRRGGVVRCLRRAVGDGRPALLSFCGDGTGRRHGLAGGGAGDRRRGRQPRAFPRSLEARADVCAPERRTGRRCARRLELVGLVKGGGPSSKAAVAWPP